MATKRVGNITINYTVPEAQTQLYNAIGRNAGTEAANAQNGQGGDNFFVKRGKSIENAFGTTGAAIASGIKSGGWISKGTENVATENLLKDTKARMNDVAKKFGYNSWSDWQDAYEQARNAGDQNLISQFEQQNKEFQAQANANAEEANKKAANYKDYMENNYVSKKINQDRGKFAGSAINTLSTAADITGLSSTPLTNAIQGGVEGIADELEQNGLSDFDWGRAGQNALIGATTGAVTGALNKGISNSLAKRAAAKGLTNTAVKSGLGNTIKQGAKAIAGGAARGALSGAVGGATGAGLQSALNGVDFGQGVQNALQGAVQGAQQGAVTGGIMAGANMAISKTPGLGKFYNDLQSAKSNWDQSGSNFDERLTNTLNSGDSGVGNWLNKRTQSKLLGAAGNLGNTIRDYVNADELVKAYNRHEITDDELSKIWYDADSTERAEIEDAIGNTLREGETVAPQNLIKDMNNLLKDFGDTAEITEGTTSSEAVANSLAQIEHNIANGSIDSNKVDINALRQRINAISDKYGLGEQKALYGDYLSKNSEYWDKLLALKPDDVAGIKKLDRQYANVTNGFDEYKNQSPTTAEGWLKKAGQRIIEDLNNKGVGLSIQDVNGKQFDTDEILNAYGKEYDRLYNNVGEPGYDAEIEQGTNYFDNDIMNNPEAANLVKTLASERQDAFSSDREAAALANVLKQRGVLSDSTVQSTGRDQYPDDINNMYIKRNDMLGYTDDGNEPISVQDALAQTGATMKTQQPTTSAWDRLAQENGYNNYDEVIQRYIEANPNTPLNQRGAAGQIMAWLDENPNTPTTAGQWAKRAGQRLVEDVNNSNLGLRVKDTSESEPQKQVYNTLMGKKTDTESRLRKAAGLKLQQQYGTVDKPTAKATNAPETLQKIADMGFTKPGDVERMADAITGSNGEVSRLVSNIVATADPVNTFDGETSGQTLDDYINLSIQKHGLDGIREGKAVKSQINALMKSLPSHADGSISYTDTPQDTFKMTQLLDAEAANYEGRSGMNYGTTNPDKLRAAQVIKDVSTLLKNRIYDTADVEAALTPEVAQNLKAYAPNNKAWADAVDNEIMTATNVKELRSAQAPWVRAKKIIDNGYMNSITYGGRNGGSGSPIPLTKRGVVGAVLNATVNSKPGLRAQAKVLNKAADIAGNMSNNVPETTTASAAPANVAPINTTPSATANTVSYNPSTQLYNAIGRTEGLNSAEQANTAKYLVDAVQEAELVPTAEIPEAGQVNAIAESPTLASTNVYNTVTGATSTGNTQTTPTNTTNSYFAPTGDYWTDILATAMTSAMNANDATAFMSLYSMYQDALSGNSSQSSSKDYSNPTNWNSSDRTKLISAQNALDQIDELESAYLDATGEGGSNAVQGWLRSRAADISGGNWDPSASNYNNLAESIGMSIIKNLINLGVTESDAERYKKYIPSITDTKTQAATKLETLRNIYQNQINNLYSVYGV